MTDKLSSLLQALPTELYDEIYHLTFTPSRTRHLIRETYKPPNSLQVSRTTRHQFAKLYYGGNGNFIIPKHLVIRYCRSLQRDHLKMIKNIRIPGTSAKCADFPWVARGLGRLELGDVLAEDRLLAEIWESRLVSGEAIKVKVVLPAGSRWLSFSELLGGSYED